MYVLLCILTEYLSTLSVSTGLFSLELTVVRTLKSILRKPLVQRGTSMGVRKPHDMHFPSRTSQINASRRMYVFYHIFISNYRDILAGCNLLRNLPKVDVWQIPAGRWLTRMLRFSVPTIIQAIKNPL